MKNYRASISDGMARNAGGETQIWASSTEAAWKRAVEWAEGGSFDQPTKVMVYLDCWRAGKWCELRSQKVSVGEEQN